MTGDRVERAVVVEAIDGRWAVFVHEDERTVEQAFDSLVFAVNFAHGQAHRLGVAFSIVKPTAEDQAGRTPSS